MPDIPYMDSSRCYGCRACEQTCKHSAINMIQDDEGFLVASVNFEKCVRCGQCKKACPALANTTATDAVASPDVYALKHRNSSVLDKSSSGGAFTALAEYVLSEGGAVAGCAFDGDLYAHHILVTSSEALEAIRGSKYVQSDTGDIYTRIEKELSGDRYVLFTGTPCQVAGLKTYLKKTYEKLITVDFICHGVPSEWLFHQYLKELGKKYHGKIIDYSFRDKKNHGWSTCGTFTSQSGSKYIVRKTSSFGDYYYALFVEGITFRECCYTCKYANSAREGDFTIGDYWDVLHYHRDFFSTEGVSALMCNTEKGQIVFERIKPFIQFVPSRLEFLTESNGNIAFASSRPHMRDTIYSDVKVMDFTKAAKKATKLSIIGPTIRQAIPMPIKRFIKSLIRR